MMNSDAVVSASSEVVGYAIQNFGNLSTTTCIYLLFAGVTGSGPMVSMCTKWNGCETGLSLLYPLRIV